MKNNTKFLLMYVAILFSFALVLILFAGVTQDNFAKENQGIKQNLIEVNEKYETLYGSMKIMTKELEDANATIEKYEKDISEKANSILATEKLLQALKMYDIGKKNEAKSIIAELDKENLTELQLYLYNKINK